MSFYNNQTLITITLDTGIDLTNMASALIKYNSVDRNLAEDGSWTGVIDAPATGGTVSYSDYDGLLPSGKYKFWVFLTDNAGKVIPTDPTIITLKPEGT